MGKPARASQPCAMILLPAATRAQALDFAFNPSFSWSALIAPLSSLSAAGQIVLLLLLGGSVLRRAPQAQRIALSTLSLYFGAFALLLIGNGTILLGWTDGGQVLRQFSVLLLGIALIRLGGVFLFRVVLPALHFSPPSILEDLLVFAGYLIWALVRLSQVGLDLGSILTTSAVLTAILAFSLQDTLGNILGGTTLQLDNSLHVGDWVEIGDCVGRVVDIRWRSTLIETRNWETVVMPNAVLMKTPFSILGRRSGEPVQWRRWVRFQVSYDIKPQRVIGIVEQAMQRARIAHVAARPAPSCVVMGINDSVVHFALRYWLTDLAVDDPTDSAVRLRIYAAFKREAIRFAFPEQTVHLVEEGEKQQASRRERDQARRQKILARIELFACLSPAERTQLAEHLIYAPFVAGETITEQGDTAHWLYLLVSGDVEILLRSETGASRSISTLRAGSEGAFFGEMGLLTGAPRSASVVAIGEVECYRLDKPDFQEILARRPAIAEEISRIMAKRKTDLAIAHEEIANSDRKRVMAQSQRELLASIRDFFHLNENS